MRGRDIYPSYDEGETLRRLEEMGWEPIGIRRPMLGEAYLCTAMGDHITVLHFGINGKPTLSFCNGERLILQRRKP